MILTLSRDKDKEIERNRRTVFLQKHKPISAPKRHKVLRHNPGQNICHTKGLELSTTCLLPGEQLILFHQLLSALCRVTKQSKFRKASTGTKELAI